ncbi:hypothetical protein MESS4_750306 [Mesorhizobium sp. STM 4661]|nr:hypothetical protein MESS4_750306 [Mesorhizobium sp. STM 4661]
MKARVSAGWKVKAACNLSLIDDLFHRILYFALEDLGFAFGFPDLALHLLLMIVCGFPNNLTCLTGDLISFAFDLVGCACHAGTPFCCCGE